MEITETQTIVKRLGGLPLLGDGIDFLGKEIGCIATNYSGQATMFKKFKIKNLKVGDDWFKCGDKGCPTLYGCDNNGQVIFAIARFKADPKSQIPAEREDHFCVKKCDSVNPHLEFI